MTFADTSSSRNDPGLWGSNTHVGTPLETGCVLGEVSNMPKHTTADRISELGTTGDGRLFSYPASRLTSHYGHARAAELGRLHTTETSTIHFSSEGPTLLTGARRLMGAVFAIAAISALPLLLTVKTNLRARNLSAAHAEMAPFRYTVSLAEISTRAQTALPLFGFGGVLHLRSALSILGAKLSSCARSEDPLWGAQRFGLRVDHTQASFKVLTIPQKGDPQLQAELSCIRDRIEAVELSPLKNLQVSAHADYAIVAVITRSLVGSSRALEPVSHP